MKKTALLAILVLLAVPTLALADNIGFVDTQKVFVAYKEARKAQETFEKKRDELAKEFEKRQEKVDEARKKNRKEDEIKKLEEDMAKELEPKRKELMEMNASLSQKLRQDVITTAKGVAKQYGVDVVLDKQVVISGGFDLTDYVIEKLNK